MAIKKVEITGGPHGARVTPKIDGKMMEGVQRIELVLDVNDAIRMVTYQVVEARIDIEVLEKAINEGGITLHVVMPEIVRDQGNVREINYTQIGMGRGLTIASALRDAADRWEKAEKSTHRVAADHEKAVSDA